MNPPQCVVATFRPAWEARGRVFDGTEREREGRLGKSTPAKESRPYPDPLRLRAIVRASDYNIRPAVMEGMAGFALFLGRGWVGSKLGEAASQAAADRWARRRNRRARLVVVAAVRARTTEKEHVLFITSGCFWRLGGFGTNR
jgi:hypothetical protein